MRWNDIGDLVNSLEDNYHDEDLNRLRINELYELILSLPDFEDDPDEVTDSLLESILEDWIDLRAER